jgi:tetratricopeptide (TPR) repeat protein
MFMRALELLPGYGPAHFSLGVMYVEAGLLDEARAEFLSALAYNPSHAQAKMFLQYVERGRKQGTPLRE